VRIYKFIFLSAVLHGAILAPWPQSEDGKPTTKSGDRTLKVYLQPNPRTQSIVKGFRSDGSPNAETYQPDVTCDLPNRQTVEVI